MRGLLSGPSLICQAAAAKRRTLQFDAPPSVDPSEAKKAARRAAFKAEENALLAASGSDHLRPRPAIAGKAQTQEAKHHHRPSGRLGDRRRKPKDFVVEFVADDLVHIG